MTTHPKYEKIPKTPPNAWISVKDCMPPEHDSIFAKFYGTEHWCNAMWRKNSDTILAVLQYRDGKTEVTATRTKDGKFNINTSFNTTVTYWMPMPNPPKED